METRGDGSGGSITSEHVALEHARVFVPGHVGKIPATQKPVKREHGNWDGKVGSERRISLKVTKLAAKMLHRQPGRDKSGTSEWF